MLEIHDHGPVRELRLARPPVNALNRALLEALAAAIDAATAEPASTRASTAVSLSSSDTPVVRPRALVLSGAPGMFSAGLDVREVVAGDASVTALVTAFFAVQERIARASIPVVAAITGHSPAGGAVLALVCDHRIMAEGAYRIGLNEVEVGLYPGETVYRLFARLVGASRAASLLPRGAMLDPAAAREAGLVDEIVPLERVVPRALELASALTALPPQAYARTRALVRADLLALFDAPPERPETMLASGWVTDETRARMAALLGGGAQGRSKT